MKHQNRLVEIVNSSFGIWTCLFEVEGEGMMTTLFTDPPNNISRRVVLLGIYSIFRDVGSSYSHQTYFWTFRTRPFALSLSLSLCFALLCSGARGAGSPYPSWSSPIPLSLSLSLAL